MSVLYENIGHVLFMLLLLCLSAFFSGSETAFFNLSRKQIEQLRHSRHHLSKLAADVALHPRRLLSALLLGNMIVNVLYFAASSILVLRFEQQAGVTTAALTGFVFFCRPAVVG